MLMLVMLLCSCKVQTTTMVDGKFVPQKELKLTIWNTQGTDYVAPVGAKKSIPWEWLKNKTKVSIGNIYGNGGGQWDSKLSQLIAGDNLPHLLYVEWGQGMTHAKKLYQAKKLSDITPELLQKYAPNLWNRTPKEFWDTVTVDGKILAIPYCEYIVTKDAQPKMTDEQLAFCLDNYVPKSDYFDINLWVRDDIAKKVFPEILDWNEQCELIKSTGDKIGEKTLLPIYTTEEYISFMRKIKDMKLTENGKPVYAFGYNGGDLYLPLDCLGAHMLGYRGVNYYTSWNVKEGKVESLLFKENSIVQKAARIQNELMREGVIDPESLVQTNTMYKEKLYNGSYAIVNVNYVSSMLDINKELEKMGKDFRYIYFRTQVQPDPEHPARGATTSFDENIWTKFICLLNTLNENELIQVLNWIDVQYTDEFEEIRWWGTKEDNLYIEENGVRRYKDERFNKYYIDGDSSALTVADTLGLGSLDESQFYVMPTSTRANRWNPEVMTTTKKYNVNSIEAWGFKKQNVELMKIPNALIYSSDFADIETCVDFWSKRGQWEDPFKLAFAADSEESFNKKWNDARKSMNEITDIDEMCNEMTKTAKALFEN